MKNIGELYFQLEGQGITADEITAYVGLNPTSKKNEGLPLPKFTYWRYTDGKIEDEVIDVYDMSARLVSILQPYQDKIVLAIDSLKLTSCLSVVLYISSDERASTPALGFNESVISFLHAVKATIDIDTYINHG